MKEHAYPLKQHELGIVFVPRKHFNIMDWTSSTPVIHLFFFSNTLQAEDTRCRLKSSFSFLLGIRFQRPTVWGLLCFISCSTMHRMFEKVTGRLRQLQLSLFAVVMQNVPDVFWKSWRSSSEELPKEPNILLHFQSCNRRARYGKNCSTRGLQQMLDSKRSWWAPLSAGRCFPSQNSGGEHSASMVPEILLIFIMLRVSELILW